MDILSCTLILFLCTLILIVAVHSIVIRGSRSATSRKLPLGPARFPVVGNLLDLGEKPHKSLAKLAKFHGSILSLKLGQVTTIVISSASMAKEVLQNHDLSFANRMPPDAAAAHQHHELSVAWLPIGTAWRNLRKICNTNIFNSQKLDANEYLRRRKVEKLLAYVEESCRAGRAVEIEQAAFDTSLNLLSNTMFSVDLADPSSENAREFKELIWAIMVELGKPNLADFFPVLKKIDPQGVRRRTVVHAGKMLDLFDSLIDQRLNLREKDPAKSKDILDILLNIIEDKNREIDRDIMKHLFLDLITAGTDTTSSTLEWAMAELLRCPETLSKARLELERTIGKGNPIEESDITRLPYLQAVVKETLRLHPATPLLLPREASADVELNGFTVPKGAQVLVNVWAISRDARKWDNPDCFVPERFLGSDVDVKGHNFELIPFGAGRRICPGLLLAIRMLHLMLGSLLHRFDWKLEDGVAPEKMDMDDKFGITLKKAKPLRAVPIAI